MNELLTNPLIALVVVVLGGAMLVLGGEWLVRGATKIALGLKISPLVVGLTVVALCTSAPEMGVSFFAALSDNKGAVEKTDVENTGVEKAAAENTAVESVADASSAELAGSEEQPALASPAPAASETVASEPATAPKEEGSVADVAIGNVVGSNICNILLILGVCGLIRPLSSSETIVRRDFPVYIVISLVVIAVAFALRVPDGSSSLPRWFGLVLLAAFVAYEYATIRQARKEESAHYVAEVLDARDVQRATPQAGQDGQDGAVVAEPQIVAKTNWFVAVALVLVGLVALVVGSQLFVNGAVAIARKIGVSELVIGLTLVAVGTSLPELTVSAVATYRKQIDVALGNVIGSNICNILLVLGGTLSLVPGGLTIRAQTLCVDLPVMAASGALAGWFCFTGRELERWEAAILLAFQCGYAAYLVLA